MKKYEQVTNIRPKVFAKEFGDTLVAEYLLFQANRMPLRFRKWFWDWKGGEFGIHRYYIQKGNSPIRKDIDKWLIANGAGDIKPPYCVLVETG